MFCDLECPDEYLNYPIYYASGKNGWAVEELNQPRENIECILEGIIKHIPQPKVMEEKSFSMLVTQTQPNSFHVKMVLGIVHSGELTIGKDFKVYDQDEGLV